LIGYTLPVRALLKGVANVHRPRAGYERNLRAIVARLRRTGARLVRAGTTPVAGDVLLRPRDRKPVDDFYVKDIAADNAIAARAMGEEGVAIDDLHGFVLPHAGERQNPNDVHFTAEGGGQLAEPVVAGGPCAQRRFSQ
jgi:lysophospholipase L1-like esterase